MNFCNFWMRLRSRSPCLIVSLYCLFLLSGRTVSTIPGERSSSCETQVWGVTHVRTKACTEHRKHTHANTTTTSTSKSTTYAASRPHTAQNTTSNFIDFAAEPSLQMPRLTDNTATCCWCGRVNARTRVPVLREAVRLPDVRQIGLGW